jgi:hypothetical protein
MAGSALFMIITNVSELPLPPAAYFLSLNRKYAKNQPKAAAFGNRGAHVSEAVCLWSALRTVFYSLGLSPPGFAENVRLRWRLGPDRSRVL